MDDVFADTGYWIARSCSEDALHQKANQVTEQIGSRRIVTSELVLIEFLNYMAKLGSHNRRTAVDTVKELQSNRAVLIVPHTTQQFQRALELYESYSDQRWGIVDCVSFQIMREKKIQDALAHDRDFHQAGFTALLRDN